MAQSVKNKRRNSSSNPDVDTQTASEQPAKTAPRVALSGWPMIFAWLAMLIFAFHACTHMVGAGDTWVAMACGRHFLNHGVDTVEPFSAYSHKAGPTPQEIETWPGWAQSIANTVGPRTLKKWHPTGWINQNWLTHVIFYWLTTKSPFADADNFSFNTLVYWKFAVYILTVICVYYTGRLLGANPALCALFACLAMFAGRSYFDIRPAGFSNLLVAAFLLVLVLTTYRNILYIWLIVPLIVFWCNVHGGYIYAFIVLVPFTGLHLLINLPRKWTAILYNLTAWPFFFFVVSRIDFEKVPKDKIDALYFQIFLFLVFLILLDFVLLLFKDRLVSIRWKGVSHTIAASFAAFVAMVIFNPFHFTNLTHTFIISVSKHAEQWRTVNEWHPAFEWANPVGTGFPFFEIFILSIGLLIFWLLGRRLKPRLLKAPRNELEAQKRQFTKLSTIVGYGMALFLCWTVFISFSFLNLSPADFFICTLFAVILLLSVFRSIHYIYLVVPLTLLSIWAASGKPGYYGRYIYPFVTLPAYVILGTFASLFSRNAKVRPKNIIFVFAAAVAGVLLMTVIFNPFKFKLPVWHLEQFLSLRRMWRPLYERMGNVPLNYTHLFSVLYIVNIVSVIFWINLPYLRRIFAQAPEVQDKQSQIEVYELPKTDLAMMVIAALTIYMAVKSRRFIPIAAIAACPILATIIDQIVRTISAACNFHRQNRLVVSAMPMTIQWFFTFCGAAAVVIFGLWWGLKFKRVYLDAWPTDKKLNSVFMRMTASDAKPFYAGMFIRENKLKGKMFNYWTEGGFIAWTQDPDPNTGKTPLRLFMDGRAQAAYEPIAYQRWSNIMAGGQLTQQLKEIARARKQQLTPEDYAKIGNWIDKQLKGHDVWVVLMPSGQFESDFVRALEQQPDWPLVFYNDKQKLFVDVTTLQGKELYDGIFDGKTWYPDGYDDGFSNNLTKAYLSYRSREKDAIQKAFAFAAKAFALHPSQASVQQLLFASRFPQTRAAAVAQCKQYFDDFTQNKNDYVKQDAYFHRIVAALHAGNYLSAIAKAKKDTKLVQFYAAHLGQLRTEQKELLERKRW